MTFQWNYYTSLGRFAHRFAEAESYFKRLYFYHMVGTADERLEKKQRHNANQLLREWKRLITRSEKPVSLETQTAIPIFEELTELRNNLFHNMADWKNGYVEIDNYFDVASGDRITIQITQDLLDAKAFEAFECARVFALSLPFIDGTEGLRKPYLP